MSVGALAMANLGRAVCAAGLWLAAMAACSGKIVPESEHESGGGGTDGGRGAAGALASAGAGGAGGVTATCSDAPTAPAAPLRRLTPFEYDNTVAALLGTTSTSGVSFTRDGLAYGTDNIAAYQRVARGMAEEYQTAAERLAAAAKLEGLVPCAPAAGDAACAATFVEHFGARAFRRPLAVSEHTRLMKVYAAGAQGATFADGIRLVIEAVLQSSSFLYRAPAPFGMDAKQAASWEAASMLSYLLWSSMPDDELFALARAGKLDGAGLAAQATRMLKDKRARTSVAHVHEQWLGLDALGGIEKDTKAVPAYKPELRAMWQKETEAFLDKVTWDEGGTVATLLTAPFTYGDAETARFYGIPAPAGGGFGKLALDGKQRAGLLTHASLLALQAKTNQTSPVLRGLFVRQQILCEELAPPPANVDIEPPDLDPTLTTRERFAQHATDPLCAGCHELMDPVGLGFESSDAIGAWRSSENGKAVDASGELHGTDVPGKFDGAVELAQRLATSDEVRSCAVRRWFRFAFGRRETEADACTLAKLEKNFTATSRLPELLVALSQVAPFSASIATPGGSP